MENFLILWALSYFPIGLIVAGFYVECFAEEKTMAQNLFVMLLLGGLTFIAGVLYYFYTWLGRFK